MIEFLEEHMFQCPSKTFLGMHCPGCGMQRSFILLLKGEIAESFWMYPALIPTILMVGFLVLHIIRKYKYGHVVLLYLFILNIGLSIFNYINKF